MAKTVAIKPQFKFLWFLMLSYTMVLAFANWFDPRLIRIFGLTTDAGTLIFPLSFLLADLITEVYGYKHARRAIWVGFLFNGIFLLYAFMVTNLPSPTYPNHNVIFDALIKADARIILASVLSYLVAEPMNSFIMAKLKMKMAGKAMSARFVLSTFIASGFDSFIFGVIAFYAVMSNLNLFYLIITMWFIKVIIEILGLPVSVRLAHRLKQKERLDIYDYRTKFNIFSLDGEYTNADNKY